jgi:ABC-type transport system involved in cytochrome c biogenesis ATPase subunit
MALLNAEHLVFAPPRGLVALSFSIRPGLTLVRGGEGRGKTSLLRAIAGELAPAGGRLQRAPGATVFQAHPLDARYDARSAQDWLTQQAQGLTASWQAALADRLVEDFALAEHLAKPMAALSSGSRRKLGLVAAAASGATLTLLDGPYAALDARSVRRLDALLAEAANQAGRAWLLADYALPAGLAQVRLAGLIELGD